MPDYMFLLESRLAPEQRAALDAVQEAARAYDTNIYLAGGAVRDLITGLPLRDLDFIVEGNPFRIAHALEKSGARVLEEDQEFRHVELAFAGQGDGSISAAREENYAQPGMPPHVRWSTAVDDLKRRDFSINAIALSLNPASRGLLLDPTNGLADIEQNHEVRVLSIHSFTNRPVRLLRAIRYSVRLGFKLEPRTGEWFALALERGHLGRVPAEHAGREVRQLTREEKTIAILNAWEKHGLITAFHPQLARRHPDYKGLAALGRARDQMLSTGLRIPPNEFFAPVVYYLFRKLKQSDRTRAINRMGFRKEELHALHHLEAEATRIVKTLKGPARKLLPKGKGAPKGKAAEARAVFDFLEAAPRGLLMFILAESSQSTAVARIRMYLNKWKPLRFTMPAAELEAMGMARSPEFDRVLENLFNLQLVGRGRNPQDRTKLLRKLAGIKPEVKKKEEKKEEKKGKGKAPAGKPAGGTADSKAAPPVAAPASSGKEPAKAATSAKKPKPTKKAKKSAPKPKLKPKKSGKTAKKKKRR